MGLCAVLFLEKHNHSKIYKVHVRVYKYMHELCDETLICMQNVVELNSLGLSLSLDLHSPQIILGFTLTIKP